MGLPMARNIANAGGEVRAWNRSGEKAEPLADDGIEVFDTAAEAASGADTILTILTDADSVLDTMEEVDGVIAGAEEEAIWMQMTTIGIEGIERDRGHRALRRTRRSAPPRSRRRPGGGHEAARRAGQAHRARLRAGWDSRRLRADLRRHRPEDALAWGDRERNPDEAGGHSWILTLVEGLGETLAFAEGIGVDPPQFLETISDGPTDNAYAQLKGKMMIEGEFEPSFKLALAAKDARLVVEAMERHDLDLPVLEAIRDQLEEAAAEHGGKDMAATYLASTPRAPARGWGSHACG
jgi:3-hydroxyisobutyrate dehydrogenase